MDRFIVNSSISALSFDFYLKSNMDRFIGAFLFLIVPSPGYLKSNMDRFIVQGYLLNAIISHI